MRPLVLVALLALAVVPVVRADDKAGMDGKWLIVYAEEGGKRNTSWESKVATLSDGTLSYELDGKKHEIKLKTGADQTLEATYTEGDKKGGKGVYIAARDYLCLSLNGEKKDDANKSSGSFILILRRQRSQ